MVWIDCSQEHLYLFLKHYQECKAKAPHTTSACIVAPQTVGDCAHLLKHMQQLATFSTRAKLYDNADQQAAVQSVTVYYDPPHHYKLNSVNAAAAHQTMTFAGTANKTNANIAFDTQASANFVSKTWLDRHHIQYGALLKNHTAGQVQLADGHLSPTLGEVQLYIRMQKWKQKIKCFVLDLKGFDVILGDPWLQQHKVLMDCGNRCAVLYRGKNMYTLNAKSKAKVLGTGEYLTGNRMDGLLLSALQVKRAARRSNSRMMLINIKESNEKLYNIAALKKAHEDGLIPQERLDALLAEYQDVFSDLPEGLPPYRKISHVIPLEPTQSSRECTG
eukprot:GHUV01017346.1.p1 GENE.GHUV01017346.1~~GHUV01017346.1.p1  ORF type:complete len:332 (-),score=77.36 GHUV01017346.1:594-1589(-)